MARASLYVGIVMAIGGPSCLVTGVPEFPEPRFVGPFLVPVDPAPSQVLSVDRVPGTASFTPIQLNVDLYSEDVGQTLGRYFVLDAGGTDARYTPIDFVIPPGHLSTDGDGGLAAARNLTLTFSIPPGTEPGCHSLTLVVMRGQFPGEAKLTWWINLADTAVPSNLMAGCNRPVPSALDGGAGGAP